LLLRSRAVGLFHACAQDARHSTPFGFCWVFVIAFANATALARSAIDSVLFKRIYSRSAFHGNRMKRVDTPLTNVSPSVSSSVGFSESALAEIETRHPDGLSTQEVVELFAARGERLTEATFRKYVQLGLLPRSVRVGRKGKHRGSQGRYPAGIVRQIDAVRALMAQGFTIQQIQTEFLGLRNEIDGVARQLSQVIANLEQAAARDRAPGAANGGDEILARAISDASQSADALVEKLRAIEQRLAMRARMARAAV
jgi:hypothetical protein